MDGIIIFDEASEGKIIRPKIIRKFPKKKKNKRKNKLNNYYNEYNSNDNHLNKPKEITFDLENISIDEINNDFLSLSSRAEEEKCFEEINCIFSNYNENNSSDEKNNNSNKIKRPMNPILIL